ncbi:hypothetical protein CASFOL_018329 [Castilleja foliolosa]|uniref:Uncharacterized protein n=1 Tax=Castilleja foliolosa TaxID=1961234 RepID=A0ABD3D6H1_9LAMI
MKLFILPTLLLLLLLSKGSIEVEATRCEEEKPPTREKCDRAQCIALCKKEYGARAFGRCLFVDTCACIFLCG